MPTRDTPIPGGPCWVDLMTGDVPGARAFYGEVFGWEATDPDPEFGGYCNFTKDGVLVAGCMSRMPDTPMPDTWSIYLATDDIAKVAEVAPGAGGSVFIEPMAVGDLGQMAVLIDAGGAPIGVWQPGTHQGFGRVSEPGAPSWFELLTRDYDKAVAFYKDVFRWETHVMSDDDEMRYTTLLFEGEWHAGVMDATSFLPEGVPAHWSVYFGVADTDEALATITRLGGSVVQPAEDTPYGRLAAATDPTGAVFKLVAANDAMPAKE